MLITPSCNIHTGTKLRQFRKQTLRRSWNHDFQSWRSLSHLTACCSRGWLVFSTQRLNNEYNYSNRESDKIIRNKLTIIDTCWTVTVIYLHKMKRRIANNDFSLQENLGESFKLEFLVCFKEIRQFYRMYWGLNFRMMKSPGLLGGNSFLFLLAWLN